ncbi:MAG: hemolysin III family protein, partial [Flavobacteriaceae bacterium]
MQLTEVDRHYQNEEKLNAYSHGLGVLLALIGSYFLIKKVNADYRYGLVAVVIYCISLVVLFSSSTLYHLAHRKPIKDKLRILDHISIYFLIAGTYTPVALITLIDGNGWTIFYVVWGIAAVGTILKLFFTGKFEVISLLLYVFMGWLIVFDFQNLLTQTTTEGLILLGL